MEGMKPVKVYSCPDRIEADMLVEALNRQGIPAYAESKGSGDYLNIYMGTSIFGETVYVDENDVSRALEIIDDMTYADKGGAKSTEKRNPAPIRQDRKTSAVRFISLIAALFFLIGAVVPSLISIFFG